MVSHSLQILYIKENNNIKKNYITIHSEFTLLVITIQLKTEKSNLFSG